jgi:hypothetical protein
MKTTSVRGTITSRTIVSPSSKTEWIICLGEVDELAELGLGRERTLAEAAPRSDDVAEHDQQLGQRPEDPREQHHEGRAHQGDALRVEPSDGAGTHADDDELDHQHRPRRHEHTHEPVVEEPEEHLGHEHRGGDLAEHPEEQRGVEVARRVLRDRQQPPGATPPLFGELLRAHLRHRRQRSVDGREEAGHQHQQRRGDQEPGVAVAHGFSRGRCMELLNGLA